MRRVLQRACDGRPAQPSKQWLELMARAARETEGRAEPERRSPMREAKVRTGGGGLCLSLSLSM